MDRKDNAILFSLGMSSIMRGFIIRISIGGMWIGGECACTWFLYSSYLSHKSTLFIILSLRMLIIFVRLPMLTTSMTLAWTFSKCLFLRKIRRGFPVCCSLSRKKMMKILKWNLQIRLVIRCRRGRRSRGSLASKSSLRESVKWAEPWSLHFSLLL